MDSEKLITEEKEEKVIDTENNNKTEEYNNEENNSHKKRKIGDRTTPPISIGQFVVNVQPNLENKTVTVEEQLDTTTSSDNIIITADDNYDGLRQVTVERILLDTTTVSNDQILNKDSPIQLNPTGNYVGFSRVQIDPIKLVPGTTSYDGPIEYISNNGNYTITRPVGSGAIGFLGDVMVGIQVPQQAAVQEIFYCVNGDNNIQLRSISVWDDIYCYANRFKLVINKPVPSVDDYYELLIIINTGDEHWELNSTILSEMGLTLTGGYTYSTLGIADANDLEFKFRNVNSTYFIIDSFTPYGGNNNRLYSHTKYNKDYFNFTLP